MEYCPYYVTSWAFLAYRLRYSPWLIQLAHCIHIEVPRKEMRQQGLLKLFPLGSPVVKANLSAEEQFSWGAVAISTSNVAVPAHDSGVGLHNL